MLIKQKNVVLNVKMKGLISNKFKLEVLMNLALYFLSVATQNAIFNGIKIEILY